MSKPILRIKITDPDEKSMILFLRIISKRYKVKGHTPLANYLIRNYGEQISEAIRKHLDNE